MREHAFGRYRKGNMVYPSKLKYKLFWILVGPCIFILGTFLMYVFNENIMFDKLNVEIGFLLIYAVIGLILEIILMQLFIQFKTKRSYLYELNKKRHKAILLRAIKTNEELYEICVRAKECGVKTIEISEVFKK